MKKVILFIFIFVFSTSLGLARPTVIDVKVKVVTYETLLGEMAEREYNKRYSMGEVQFAKEQLEQKYTLEEVIVEEEACWRCTPKEKIISPISTKVERQEGDMVVVEHRVEYKEVDNPDFGNPDKIAYVKIPKETKIILKT